MVAQHKYWLIPVILKHFRGFFLPFFVLCSYDRGITQKSSRMGPTIEWCFHYGGLDSPEKSVAVDTREIISQKFHVK